MTPRNYFFSFQASGRRLPPQPQYTGSARLGSGAFVRSRSLVAPARVTIAVPPPGHNHRNVDRNRHRDLPHLRLRVVVFDDDDLRLGCRGHLHLGLRLG